MGDRVHQLETDLRQAAEIGNLFITKNANLEKELEETRVRYVATVEKLEQELHSTRMKLECSIETEKCLNTDLENALDQLAKSKKESLAHKAALKKLQAAFDEKDSTASDQAFVADIEKLHKQIRRLEEQLCESRQMNERLLSHNTSASAGNSDSLDTSRAAFEQETQLVIEQLHDEIAELKAEKETALQRLGEAEDRLKTALHDLSAQKTLFQNLEDECGELRAQLESLQMEQLDPKRRGNSIFSEVEDRRLKQEKELLSLRTHYRALQEKERFLREEVRRTRNQMALILATGSGSRADARQLRLLQESLTTANAEISRLTGALARQTNERASQDDISLDGNPLAGILKMERHRVKELEKEREALLKSVAERQAREGRLLRETHEAARKAETLEAQLLKAMVRKSEEQPLSAGFESKKEVHENLGMVEDEPVVLREIIPMQQKAETVETLDSKPAGTSAGPGKAELKKHSGERPKVTFEEGCSKENEPDTEADSKKKFKPLHSNRNTAAIALKKELFALRFRAYNRERHSNILNTIFDKNAYDNGVRPPTINGTGPVRVEVSMFVLSIPEVSEKHMDYTMQVFFRQSWLDPRLAFDDRAGDVQYVNLYDPEKIWKPDAFFSNEKEGHFHDLPGPNFFIRIFPTGRVLYSTRLTLKLSCPMNLKRYPFDTQSCSVVMPSYKYTTEDIMFAFALHEPVKFYKDLLVRNYKLTGYILGSCTSRTVTGQEAHRSTILAGDYSCVRAEIWFQRLSRSLDVLVFIPCAMYVLLSWIPLWLDNSGAATRTRLTVPALVLIAMASTVSRLWQSEFPRTSYTKAVDVWTTVTLAFVIALWIDVAIVELVVSRQQGGAKRKETVPRLEDKKFGETDAIEMVEHSNSNPKNGPARHDEQGRWQSTIRNWLKAPRSTADKVDLVSRIVFPVAFLLFVVIYIRNYAVKTDVPEEWL
ncbi:hypothetical protein HPB50_014657 [Hyalomma asiaticum]|uniref:Uncharacterized protein n=1 Tax=Hyalomma asiaticum TaxID=266040 RepID=A0ACB7S7M9_HYAAI|nr:hypothetical protein HPB50_014657 [Hyalomma asiaticum]